MSLGALDVPPLHATQNTLGVQQQQVETGFNFSVDSCVVWCVAGLKLGQGAVCVWCESVLCVCGVRACIYRYIYVYDYTTVNVDCMIYIYLYDYGSVDVHRI